MRQFLGVWSLAAIASAAEMTIVLRQFYKPGHPPVGVAEHVIRQPIVIMVIAARSRTRCVARGARYDPAIGVSCPHKPAPSTPQLTPRGDRIPSLIWSEETAMSQAMIGAAREEKIKGSGGELFIRSWRPAGAARAALMIVPGFNAHSGQYGWVAEQLSAVGVASYAVDLRGRGQSDGERFFVE